MTDTDGRGWTFGVDVVRIASDEYEYEGKDYGFAEPKVWHIHEQQNGWRLYAEDWTDEGRFASLDEAIAAADKRDLDADRRREANQVATGPVDFGKESG